MAGDMWEIYRCPDTTKRAIFGLIRSLPFRQGTFGAGEGISALIFEGMQRKNDSALTWEVTRDGSRDHRNAG